jgi:Fe-S-cluster containining protein
MKPLTGPERDVLQGVEHALAALGYVSRRRPRFYTVNPEGKLVRSGRPGKLDLTVTCPSGPHRGKRVEVTVTAPGRFPSRKQVDRMRQVQGTGPAAIAFWVNDENTCIYIPQIIIDGWTVEIADDKSVRVAPPDESAGPHPSTFQCDLCGACCRTLLVDIEHVDVVREPCLLQHARLYDAGITADEWDRDYMLACPWQPCGLLGPDNHCTIYPTRPNCCVAFQAGSEQCQEARKSVGLAPLAPKGAAP